MNNLHSKELIDAIKSSETLFINLIKERLGIIIHIYQTKELCDAILEACIKFNLKPYDYFNKIKTCPTDSALLEFLVAGITVGETSFFRDKYQMKLIQHILLPQLIRAKEAAHDLTLRIWSAGCSTGEEIYTIAMLLTDMILLSNWTLHLLGTDINKAALEKAKAGIYSRWSMRSIPDYYKNKYFIEKNKMFKLSKDIINLVNFSYLNLNENFYPSILNGTVAQDLILCRNVMIYFDNEHITQIMNKFSQCLNEKGLLLLGASDPINIADTSLILHHEEGIYFSRG
jgi:chemotaxis protein methyltransferase CheR